MSRAGSLNADKIPLEASATGLAKGYRLELASPLVIKDGKFHACLVAPGCCTAAPAGATLTVRGVDPHYHDGAVVAVSRRALFTTDSNDHHAFLGTDRRGIVQKPGDTVDIDSLDDLYLAEAILRLRRQRLFTELPTPTGIGHALRS